MTKEQFIETIAPVCFDDRKSVYFMDEGEGLVQIYSNHDDGDWHLVVMRGDDDDLEFYCYYDVCNGETTSLEDLVDNWIWEDEMKDWTEISGESYWSLRINFV